VQYFRTMTSDISGFTLDDALLIVVLQRRTGELLIESGNNIGSIHFHEGNVLQALSPYSRAIGDLLVEDGILTESELLEVLKLQKLDPDIPIGALLINTGKVNFEAVEMMVHEQIRQALGEFKVWVRVNISFVEKDLKPVDTIHLPAHEFISAEVLAHAHDRLSRVVGLKSKAPAPSIPSSPS
jgi:hypothetical protein